MKNRFNAWRQRLPAAALLAIKWVFIVGVIFPALLYILLRPVLPGWAVALPGLLLLIIAAGLATLGSYSFTSLRKAAPESYNGLVLQLNKLRSSLAIIRHLLFPHPHPTQSGPLPPLIDPGQHPPTPFRPAQLCLPELPEISKLSKDQAKALGLPEHPDGSDDRSLQYVMLQNICMLINQTLLTPHGLFWTSSRGYLDLWTEIHQAQEILVTFLPASTLIDDTRADLFALQGSAIPDCQQQIDLLTRAIQTLDSDPAATRQPDPGQSGQPTQAGGERTDARQLPALLASGLSGNREDADTARQELLEQALALLAPSPTQTDAQARAAIRTARYKIHSFLDTKWADLVRLRISLMQTAIFTCIFTYALLLLPLFYGAPVHNVIAFTGFYVTGALAGLFLRLFTEWKLDNASNTDDYGLTRERILVTPLLCGIAAIGGVLIASILALSFSSFGTAGSSASTTPQVLATVSVSGSSVQVTVVPQQPATQPQSNSLDRIFNLQTNPGGLIWAAVFGLVPNLLINILRQQAQKLQGQIQSAQPNNPTTSSNSSSLSSSTTPASSSSP